MATILVTGSSGFVGALAAERLLTDGHQVIGLDPVALPGAPAFRFVQNDLMDRPLLEHLLAETRPTHIIHAGGVSGPMVIPDQPAAIMDANVTGSLNLIQAALAARVGTFVYCSSIAAVGPFSSVQPVDENQPLRPDSPYGFSKAAVEMVLRGLWRRVPMQISALRFTGIYGPGRQTSFLPDDMIAAALAGTAIRIPPTAPGPYLYGDDAAEAAVLACFAEQKSQFAYYVAHHELVSVEMMHAIISREIGPFECIVDHALNAVERGPVDLTRTSRDLGFAARTGFDVGLRRLIEARRGPRPS